MEQQLPKPEPLLSDYQLATSGSTRRMNLVTMVEKVVPRPLSATEVRDIYESELQRLRSQVEAMRVAGSAMQQVILDTMAFNKLPNPTLRPSQAVKDWTASLNPTPTTEAK